MSANLLDVINSSPRQGLESKLKKLGLYQELQSLTSFLDEVYEKPLISQRLYHFENRKFVIQRCEADGCENPAKWKRHVGYVSCSRICATKVLKQRNREKFGVDMISELESVKKKISDAVKIDIVPRMKKLQESLQAKFGVDNVMKIKEVVEKVRNTNLERYGDEYNLRNSDVKAKIKATFIKNFGVDHPMKSDEFRKIHQQIMIRNNGFDNYGKSDKNKTRGLEPLRERLGNNYEIIDYLKDGERELFHKICGNKFKISKHTLDDRIKYNHEPCAICNPTEFRVASVAETQICEFLDSLGINYKRNVRELIPPLEIDIYIPSHGLCIEYNGCYYHNSVMKHRLYHQQKSIKIRNLGLQLFHIYEHDWINKPDKIKSLLKQKLNFNNNKVYARKLKIIEIKDTKAEIEFLNENHFQGYNSSNVCMGLYGNDELIQIMSFKYKHNNTYEIQRLCTKSGYNVVGGSERLFRHFINKYKPNYVYTFSSLDMFTGGVYEKLGMKLEKITEPSYCYVSRNFRVLSRNQCQKHKLVEQGFDNNKSESKIMNERGFMKIYNSGNLRFGIRI